MSNFKPFTTSEMIENSSNWNLAGDARLLRYLESFSEEFVTKAEETHENLNKLTDDLNTCGLSLDLVKKEFSSLHNTQFIESRVYEDDYAGSVPPDENVEQTKVDADTSWKSAVLNGIEVAKMYYEKVEVPASDSEDDTDFPSFVLRAKDPYADRRLPYVIGTEEWHKKWHVGLLDTSSESEDEGDNAAERYSESEPEDLGFDKRRIYAEDDDSLMSHKHPVANSTFEESSNLFGSSSSGENNSVHIQTPVLTNSFASELTRKLGHVIEQNPAVIEPEVNKKPIRNYGSSRVIGNLFDDEPPPLDDNEEDLFDSSIKKGLFSGGSGLFDDLPSDDDWSGKPKDEDKSTAPKQKLPDLFDDDQDDQDNLFFSSDKISAKTEPRQSKKTFVDLFDDEGLDQDDYDLFKDTLPKSYNKSFLSEKSSSSLPYLPSEPPELNAKQADKKPIGGVKIFPDSKPTAHSNPDKSDNLDITVTQIAKDIPNARDLFDDFHNGSINSVRINEEAAAEQPKPAKSASVSAKPKINLFDDTDDIFGEDLFSSISVRKFTSDLFSDEAIGGDLFAPDENKKALHENLGFASPKTNKPRTEEKMVESCNKNDGVKSQILTFSDLDTSNERLTAPKEDDSFVSQAKTVSINVGLFDENPPDLDDDWDSKSDTLFDDNENLFDSTSVVTGHRSGLFDQEPPSLLSESSGIVRDMSTRVETDDSFNPYASSSRRFSTDIFNDQQSNDSFFVTKNRSIDHHVHSHLGIIPENADSFSSVDITASGNPDSLFSQSITTFEDNLFSQDVSSIRPISKLENDRLFSSSTTNVLEIKSENNQQIFESSKLVNKDFSGTLDDPPENRVTGSEKVLETSKLEYEVPSDNTEQENEANGNTEIFETNKSDQKENIPIKGDDFSNDATNDLKVPLKPVDSGESKDDFASKIGAPGKLKHNLAINVNALIPGRNIITKRDVNINNSLEGDISETNEDTKTSSHPANVSHTESEILSSFTKDRAKIPVKRRPSTRKARQEAIRNSMSDFKINVSPLEEPPLNTEVPNTNLPAEDALPPEIDFKPIKNDSDIPKSKSFTSSSLFDDSDDGDDLFSSVKLPSRSKSIKQSLFDDESDDGDIFGSGSFSIKQKSDTSASKNQRKTLAKPTLKTKLENTSVTDDPLNLFRD